MLRVNLPIRNLSILDGQMPEEGRGSCCTSEVLFAALHKKIEPLKKEPKLGIELHALENLSPDKNRRKTVIDQDR